MANLQSLLGTFEKLGASFQSLDPDRLISALAADPDGIDELIAVTQDASKLYTQNKSLIELFMHYMTGENSEKIADFLSFISSEETKAALYDGDLGVWAPGDQVAMSIGQSDNLFTPIEL